MTHRELMDRMDGQEFAYWAALYRVEQRERKAARDEAKQGRG